MVIRRHLSPGIARPRRSQFGVICHPAGETESDNRAKDDNDTERHGYRRRFHQPVLISGVNEGSGSVLEAIEFNNNLYELL
jgi:hypothetical protein